MPADIEFDSTDLADARRAAAAVAQAKKPADDTTKAKSGPKPTSTPSQPKPADTPRKRWIRQVVEELMDAWCKATGQPKPRYDLQISPPADTFSVVATWKSHGYPYTGRLSANWDRLDVTIDTTLPTSPQKANTAKDIANALAARETAIKGFQDRYVQWLNMVEATNTPKPELVIEGEGSNHVPTLHWTMPGNEYVPEVRYIGTATRDAFSVRLRAQLPWETEPFEAGANSKQEFEEAIRKIKPNPEQQRSVKIGWASQAFNAWLGENPGGYSGADDKSEPGTIKLRSAVEGRLLWGFYRLESRTLRVFAQVPAGTNGARKIKDEYFVPVADRSKLERLPKPTS
jgi:hypothetical protein